MSRKLKESIIEKVLGLCALITILTTIGIVLILLVETVGFFREVSIVDFLTQTQWTPLFTQKSYGILPLLAGTFLTTFIAIAVALPVGLTIAIYLNEYASKRFRKVVKPLLEVLAVVPTVVYGFFALLIVTPFLKSFIPELSGFNALSPGIVMGIMIIP
ncbi:MAG: hypothetical protein JXR26_09370, partial [Balneolaceae bacterium]|nr:hypothetical protein [Balneolaceae bacterium]